MNETVKVFFTDPHDDLNIYYFYCNPTKHPTMIYDGDDDDDELLLWYG